MGFQVLLFFRSTSNVYNNTTLSVKLYGNNKICIYLILNKRLLTTWILDHLFFFFCMARQSYMGLGLLVSSTFHDHTFETHHIR
jgi:hypothetical protein